MQLNAKSIKCFSSLSKTSKTIMQLNASFEQARIIKAYKKVK